MIKDDYKNAVDFLHEILDTIYLKFQRKRYDTQWTTWTVDWQLSNHYQGAKETLLQILSDLDWSLIYENRFIKDWSAGSRARRLQFHHFGLGAEMFVTTNGDMVIKVTMRRRKLSSPTTPS